MDIVFNRKSQFEALGRLSAELGVDVREDTLELPVALLETRPRLRIALRLALFYVPPLILVVLVGVLSWGWDLLFPIWAIWCLAAIALYGVVVTPGFHHVSRERLLLVRVTPWRYRVREILIDESPADAARTRQGVYREPKERDLPFLDSGRQGPPVSGDEREHRSEDRRALQPEVGYSGRG